MTDRAPAEVLSVVEKVKVEPGGVVRIKPVCRSENQERFDGEEGRQHTPASDLTISASMLLLVQ
jgi:hypothetical protein